MSRAHFRDGSEKGARLLSETVASKIFRDQDKDPIWNEYTYAGSAHILVPREQEAELVNKLRMMERERFVTHLSRAEFQQDLWDFLDSEEFVYLKSKWLENSRKNSNRAFEKDDDDEEEVQVLKALKNVEDLKTPHNSKDFISQVESCMSDIADYGAPYEGMVRLFTAKSVIDFVEEIGEDSDRMARAWRMFVSMARFNGYRRIIKQSKAVEERLKLLREQFPNFSHVVDHIIGQLRVWALKREGERRIKPINLNGPKGTGKTAFANALADALETRFDYVNIASTSMAGVLTGISNKWGNGQPGIIFSSLARGDTASPVILLDEIDKTERSSQYPVEGSLLALLEHQTSRELRDEFGNLKLDASRIIYVATSNDASLISAPLKSRFDTFEIGYPNRRQREVIIGNMLKKSYINTRFSPAALRLMACQDVDLRNLQSLLDKVVRQHVDTVLSQMAAGDAQEFDDIKGENLGQQADEQIVPSLHGEQVIEELTVRICLQDLGCKTKTHFGFVEV